MKLKKESAAPLSITHCGQCLQRDAKCSGSHPCKYTLNTPHSQSMDETLAEHVDCSVESLGSA